jgi:tripartite-type tricarboxylate transporter receptor subunit TctC
MRNQVIRRQWRGLGAGLALAALAAASPAMAQTFPEKPIRFVIPSPPGGGTDTLSRLIANKLTETLKWQILPDNRPGAGGNLGMDIAAKAAPDGYTIALGESANLTINPYLYTTMTFDAAKDLSPIVLVGTVPLVLVTSPARPFDTLAKVAAAARQKPLTFASSGNGTMGHLAGEIWMRRAGVELQHVPYRGGAAAVTDVVAGQVDLHFASIPAAASMLVDPPTLRALAVTTTSRTPDLPAVPTFEEAGYPGFTPQVVYGVVGPARMPPAIVERLNAEINRVLQAPDVKERLARIGANPRGGTPGEFAQFLTEERAKMQKAVADSGARID